MLSNARSRRKVSGGLYKAFKKGRECEKQNPPSLTGIGKIRKIKRRMLGGSLKNVLLSTNKVNIYIPKKKGYEIAEIKSVIDNAANRHYIRRNIITKGAVIETSIGKAKITSRPGQDGVVNAVLLE